MDTVTVLTKARDLVAKNWIQGALNDGGAGFCAIGAIHHNVGGEVCDDDNSMHGPCHILAKAAGLSGILSLADWNDHPDRTQLQVIAAFDKAIALAEGRRE